MKVVLRSSSPLFSALGIPRAAPAGKVLPVLRRGAADIVHIGMPALDVLAAFPGRTKFDELNTRADIFPSPSKRHRPDLTLAITDDLVSAIRVYSSRYKTETGVGPGDSLTTLATLHEIHWTDENTAEVHDLNMKFQFAKDRIISVLLS
jgi:hypothetical protein